MEENTVHIIWIVISSVAAFVFGAVWRQWFLQAQVDDAIKIINKVTKTLLKVVDDIERENETP